MTVVITPVGTSLFTNGSETNNQIKTYFSSIKKELESKWDSNAQYIKALKTQSEAFIRTKGISAAAELQSTAKIKDELSEEETIIHLLASETIASRLAAEILSGNVASGILDRGVSVRFDARTEDKPDIINGLQVKNRKQFLRIGMNALICRIEKIVSTLTGSNTSLAINITGGYAATLPYLTIYAQLKRVPLYYNFEDSNELIEIPHSPLTIDWDAIKEHFDVLQKINDAEALENWENFKNEHWEAVNELEPFILVDVDDNSAYLSPLAVVFWDECLKHKHQVSFPDPVTIAPDQRQKVQTEIKDGISGEEHHRPKGWERYVKRLCENAYVEYVRYDSGVHGGKSVKVLDNGNDGHIGVQYTKDDKTLPLRVETTANGKQQTELVMEYIKRQLKI